MHIPSNHFTEQNGYRHMHIKKKQTKKKEHLEGTVPTLKIWVYCITTSQYIILYYYLTKAKL